MPKTIPELSVESKLVTERLMKAEVGDVITYKEISEIVGFDIQKKRGPLQTAMNRCVAEGFVFGTVRSQGVKRLANDEIPSIGLQAAKKNQRNSSRALRKLSCCIAEELSDDKRTHFFMLSSLHAMNRSVASDKAMRKLEDTIANNGQQQLPLAKTLEAFRKQ